MPEPARTAIHLTLLRRGNLILVDLADTGSLIARSETHVDDVFLRDLAAELEHLAAQRHADGAPAVVRTLERVGGLVFSHLLTEPARRRLHEAEPTDLYLRLDEELVHVPWELCHDGTAFLGMKFRVARQVITGRPIPDTRAPAVRRARLRVLLVADPTETLPQAGAEAEQLCAVLDGVAGVEVTLLGGRSVRRIPLLAALQEHDVVHFAGHSHYDVASPAQSGWHLGEGVLTAAELSKLRPAPLLVFSNSCAAGRTAAWERGSGYEGHAFGIGSAFLLAGVRNYVGTFWVVHDDESLLFATTCYRALAGGASLGAALQAARQAVIAEHGWEGLTWASYLLYGDPTLTLLAGPVPGAAPPASVTSGSPPRGEHRLEISIAAHVRAGEPPTVGAVAPNDPHVVGRERERAWLSEALDAASRGERTVAFVGGPPGIGKTTLVDTFLAEVQARGDVWIGHGQSVEQYGSGEAYLPVLEAWNRLGHVPDGRLLLERLRRHAPTWLAELPGLLDPAEYDAFQRRAQGATRERMLREMAELLEAVAVDRPIVLVLEDLHWSDHSTLELVAYLAQRREPARLLVIGTYRPAAVMGGDHPLRAITHELQAKGRSRELRLEPLDAPQVGEYLRRRLAGGEVDDALARAIHRRTDGNPLFVVNVVDFALRRGLIGAEAGRWVLRGGEGALESDLPDSLRRMLERQIEALAADEQEVLEAASVAGTEFSIAAVAAALEQVPDRLDDRCEGLAWRGQLVRTAGIEEWPDGTVAGRYRFVHALYQELLYARVAAPRRVRFHRRIAERKAAAYGGRIDEIAGELAAHFEAARDGRQALAYHTRVGDNAVRRHADHEAIAHFGRALRLLPALGDGAERTQRELEIQVKLATPLMSTKGYAAPEVEAVFTRAHALSRQVVEGPHRFPLLRGLVSFYQVRAQHQTARVVGEELLALCAGSADAIARVQADYGQGVTLYDLVELDASQAHLERALAQYDPESHAVHVSVYGGYDPGVACRCWLAWLLWLRGAPDRALRAATDALALADRLGHPFTTSFAHMAAAMVRLSRGDVAGALPHVSAARALVRDEGFAYHAAVVSGLEGWALLRQRRPVEAVARLEDALSGHEATGAGIGRPGFLALLGYATAFAGGLEDGLRHVQAGIDEAERTQQRLHLVPLRLARADLQLFAGGGDPACAREVEAGYRAALDFAHELGSPILALQAGARLARLLAARGRAAQARALLAPLYGAFQEGFTIAELVEAKALLDSL